MSHLLQDVRFGLRTMIKNPGFTILSIFILGFGIGITTVIFSVVNAVLLNSLPYHEAERLVMVWDYNRGQGISSASWPQFADWQSQQTVFESIASSSESEKFTLTGGEEPELVSGLSISPTYFDVFKFKPLKGRLLYPEDSKQGNPLVTVITEDLWKRRFNSDPNLIGKTIQLSLNDYVVVGILPKKYRLVDDAQIFIPIVESKDLLNSRGWHVYHVFARLKQGITFDQAQSEMDIIASRLEKEYPNPDTDYRSKIVLLHKQITGGLRPALLALLAAVFLVLFISCANIANLQLVRSSCRSKEITVRVALGASRWRIIRQLLTESLMLSLAGGAAGILLAYWMLDLLLALSSSMLPAMITVNLDWYVLGFAIIASIVTGILFGFLPAISVTKTELAGSMKESGRGNSQTFRRNRSRNTLIAAETGLALVLLSIAGLILQSFTHLSQVNPGFRSTNLLTVSIYPPLAKYGRGEKRNHFFSQVIEQIKSIPGVENAGGNITLPMGSGGSQISTSVIGRTDLPESAPHYRIVTPDYFKTMGIALKQGRAFDIKDTTETTLVVMVNEAYARQVFPNENPIGKKLEMGDGWSDKNGRLPREIVGVAGNIRQFSPGEEPQPEVYVPHGQSKWNYELALMIRTKINPESIIPAVRKAIWNEDKDQALGAFSTMTQIVDNAIIPQRFNTILLVFFCHIRFDISFFRYLRSGFLFNFSMHS